MALISLRASKNFKGDFAKFLDSQDSRIDGKAPFELI